MDASDHEKLALRCRIATDQGGERAPEDGRADCHDAGCGPCGRRDPHVHVVVVVDGLAHGRRRPDEPGARADKDDLGARADEAVEQVLGEPPVDLRGSDRLELPAVEPRVIDVGVEAVLVAEVTEASVPSAERATSRPREVADAEARRLRMRRPELPEHAQESANEPVGAVPPPRPVRRPVENRVPREEVTALGREQDALDEPPVRGRADRARHPPDDLRRERRRRIGLERIGGGRPGAREDEHERDDETAHVVPTGPARARVPAGSV